VCAPCCVQFFSKANEGNKNCDECVEHRCPKAEAPPPPPPPPPAQLECHPERHCNVCKACCAAYIPDGKPCAECVKTQCKA
jgi:hypothetical protein